MTITAVRTRWTARETPMRKKTKAKTATSRMEIPETATKTRQRTPGMGIPTKLEALKEEDLDFLAESAHADACAPGNPKDASVEDLKNLFRKLM